MNKYSKYNRHRSHLRGNEFVNSFNGLRIYPTFDTDVNIPGKYAKVDVALNLGSHPLPELTDVSTLEQMKVKMEKARKVRISTTPAPVAPIAPVSEQKQKRKRKISPWGWIALALAPAGSIYGTYQLIKKTA